MNDYKFTLLIEKDDELLLTDVVTRLSAEKADKLRVIIQRALREFDPDLDE